MNLLILFGISKICLRIGGNLLSYYLQDGMLQAGSSLADFATLKMEAIRSSKRRFTQDLHGAKSQKTVFFIVTELKTSNLTFVDSLKMNELHKHWYDKVKHKSY
jgi:hypothetical protein